MKANAELKTNTQPLSVEPIKVLKGTPFKIVDFFDLNDQDHKKSYFSQNFLFSD